jgi:hypothetical protein
MALGVLFIFTQSGGALTVIAAGVFGVVAVVAPGCERIIKTLEDIRDGRGAQAPETKSVVLVKERNLPIATQQVVAGKTSSCNWGRISAQTLT